MIQLLTGASGFLGQIINSEIIKLGSVVSLSRNNATINVDLKNEIPNLPISDLVIHCAGKAHFVPKKQDEIDDFFLVNVQGTKNLLTGIEQTGKFPSSFILISTVAVYGLSFGVLVNEQHELMAKDAYGRSKIMAESLVSKWCERNNVICTILRLPLIVGKKPPGNLGAMISAIKKGYYFNVGGGEAKKSMVMASDVAKLIPRVAIVGGIYNLTDGYHPTFQELSNVIAEKLKKSRPINIPLSIAKFMAKIGDLIGNKAPINSNKLNKITSDLIFDDSKARNLLEWKPDIVIEAINVE